MTEEKISWETLISSVEYNVVELEKYILTLTPEKAYKIFNDTVTSSELLRMLIELQSLHSVVLGMHPISLYATEEKTGSIREIYNECLDTAKTLSKMIELALRFYSDLKSSIQIRFQNTELYCYDLIIKEAKDTGWSFYGVLLQIIRISRDLISFFKYFEEFEKRKGQMLYPRRIGELEKYEKLIEKRAEVSKKQKELQKTLKDYNILGE